MPTPPTFSTNRTAIAGVGIVGLARQFGTPLYVYDAAKIVERVRDLAAFDVVRYAQKACSNIAILDLIRREGALVDTVSAGEIHRALAAGYTPQGDPPPIVYTADIFDRPALETVLAHGIHVNCGSPEMIDQYGKACASRRVNPGGAPARGDTITLRINPGFGHGHSQKTNTGGEHSKHGIWHEQLADVLRRADQHGLAVTGLHLHIGSGTDLAHLSQVCGAMERLAKQVGRSLTTISAGGGLPVPYREGQSYVDLDRYYKLWDATRKRLEEAFGHKLRLEIEPGRYLVAESGFLIAEIRAVKQMGANTFYLLDAGFNNLARPILYGAYHPMSICPADGEPPGVGEPRGEGEPPGSSRRSQEVVVGGPLCESGDIFTQEEGGFVARRSLPAAQVGDYLIIEVAGAYGSVMASNYNSKPLPAEVLIRNQKPHLIRARQSVEDITRGEQIPGERDGDS
jgi:diaminopimelate decarboxylase